MTSDVINVCVVVCHVVRRTTVCNPDIGSKSDILDYECTVQVRVRYSYILKRINSLIHARLNRRRELHGHSPTP